MATILTKKSDTSSSVPLAADLTNAAGGSELAVNTADKRIYTKTPGGTVVELGTNPSALALPNGTANGVAYLNGSKVLTSGSALTFDGTVLTAFSGGTTVISSKATTANTAFVSAVGNNGTVGGTSFDMIQDGTGIAYLYNRVNQPITFGVNNAEQMRLTSTGLGIGTSSPSFKLDVNGIGYFRDLLYVSGSHGISTDSASPLLLKIGGTEKMRLDPSGNLGLGVTPSAWGTSGAVFKVIEYGRVGNAIAGISSGSSMDVMSNAYYNGGWKYANTGVTALRASLNGDTAGAFSWNIAPSGTAGAAISFTQAMTLDASGNLGVGTTTASARLTVATAVDTSAVITSSTSGNTTLRVANTNTGGNSFDVASGATGHYLFGNGSIPVIFGVNATERARIDSSGNLLVGTTSNPGNRSLGFSANASGNGIDIYQNENTSDWAINTSSGSICNFYSDNGSSLVFAGSISVGGNVTTYGSVSDYRLKENIQLMSGALEKVQALKPVTFTFKNSGQVSQGFIAHELQAVVPDAVTGEKDAVDAEGKPVYQGVDTSFLVATLTAAIQEQQAIIEDMKTRLAAAGI